jgi:DNA-binding NarL/FixJ family response regulator
MEGGGELLIINGNERDLRGLVQLFATAGIIASPAQNTAAARTMVETKYFTVVLLDAAAGPEPAAEFLGWLRDTSPSTEVIVTTDDPSFDIAVTFFRHGALDVIPKKREQVDYLKNRVLEASKGQKLANESTSLLAEARAVTEEFFNVLMELARKNLELSGSTSDDAQFIYALCVVDPEELLAAELTALTDEFDVTHCLSNGEALDKVATGGFNLLVAPVESDLPGRMVARTALKHRPEMDAWLYSGRPGEGEIIPVEPGGTEGRPQPFPDLKTFASGVLKRKARAGAMARERRAIEVIKSQNIAIVRKYGALREKIDTALKASKND